MNPTFEHQERLINLIEDFQQPLAAAIARQIRTTVPRYGRGEPSVEMNIEALLAGVPALVRGESLDELCRTVGEIVVDRARKGFRVGDFSLACLCFLPVLRHFLLEKSPKDGLVLYEVLEAVALPFMGRCMAMFVERPKLPSENEVTTVLGLMSKRVADASDGRSITPIAIERV